MNEKVIKALPGAPMLVLAILLFPASLASFFVAESQDSDMFIYIGITGMLIWTLLIIGFFTVEPNGSKVLLLFGRYVGTVKEPGFRWANPFLTKRNLSLRVRTLNGEKLKVNDSTGNPIEIAVVIIWRVLDTYASSFQVEDYEAFVQMNTETALRHTASIYPYDGDDHTVSLRQHADEVSNHIRDELQVKLKIAGIEVMDARIAHLAYSAEIAGAMLRRQQADAVIAARQRIVDGAVGMVEMALVRMQQEGVIELDEERKAHMVSNLMVVLCSEHGTQPVVNTGTLY